MLIYGANGYTGKLIASEAVKRGLRPTLAGRNRQAIEALAKELACTAVTFDLDSAEHVARHLSEWRQGRSQAESAAKAVVLNCAGPFEKTAPVMMPACVQAGVSYLDITGEIPVIEQAASLSESARKAGICLMPAVGFDVVPSDCFAAALAARCPGATHLRLAFAPGGAQGSGGLSHGTARTAWDSMPRGGMIRRQGKLEKTPAVDRVEKIAFPRGPRQAVTIPWGDVASAFYSTGIPNIEVYMAMPKRTIQRIRRWRWLAPAAGWWPISALGRRWIKRNIEGPTAEERAQGYVEFWGAAWKEGDAAGPPQRAEGTMITPEGYTLTVQTAVDAALRVEGNQVSPGFQTPSRVFNEDDLRSFVGAENLVFKG